MPGRSFLKVTLVEAAWAATKTKNTYLSEKYKSLAIRRGKKRALIAIAHKILVSIYHMLTNSEEYKELGANYLRDLNKNRKSKYYLKRLDELGIKVDIISAI